MLWLTIGIGTRTSRSQEANSTTLQESSMLGPGTREKPGSRPGVPKSSARQWYLRFDDDDEAEASVGGGQFNRVTVQAGGGCRRLGWERVVRMRSGHQVKKHKLRRTRTKVWSDLHHANNR